MNLLKAVLYDPSTAVSKATSALLAMTAFDTTNLRLAITVPAHGMVYIRIMGGAVTGATTVPTLFLGVMNGATVLARVTPQDFPGTMNATTQSCPLYAEFVITGLTPGAMNLDLAYGVEVLVALTNIKYGGPNDTTTNNAWGGISFQAWDPQPQTANSTLAVDTSGRVTVGAIVNGAIAAATFAANALDAVWSTATRLLTAGTNIALAKGTGITGFNDLSAAQVNAEADTALADVGVTLAVTARIDAAVSTRAAASTAVSNADYTAARAAKLDNADATTSSRLASVSYTAPDNTTIAAINAKTTNLPSDPADESLIIAATDAVMARLGAPAGASVSADVAAVKSDTAAVKLKTDNLPASPAATGAAMTLTTDERNSVADAFIGRNVAGGSSTGRLVKDSLAFLRNKWTLVGDTLTVYDTDDATPLWTATVARTAGDPVSSSDPA